MSNAQLQQALKDSSADWTRAVIFTKDTVLASINASDLSMDLLKTYFEVFQNKEQAYTNGFDLHNVHYDLHKWYKDYVPALAWGRKVGPTDDEGIALAHSGDVFMLITYSFPIVSAYAVSLLRDFMKKYIVDKAL